MYEWAAIFIIEFRSTSTHSKVAGSTITIFIFLTVLKFKHNFKNIYKKELSPI